MSPKIFDWSKLHADIADETFGIPPDVVFQIVEDGELHEVKAHKTILAMVSLPFKTMFYTTEVGDKTSKAIKIEPAFQIMINAVYETKSIEESLKDKCVQEVFDVIHLIEQYQIAELAEAMEKYLADYPVTEDSVLEVAAEASQYTTLFQKESKHLLLTCAKFLKPKLKDLQSVSEYASKTDHKEVFWILLALMKEIPPTECSNCGYENCQDGKPIKEDEFRVGLIVTNNKAANYYWTNDSLYQLPTNDRGTGNVTSVNEHMVTVATITSGPYAFGGSAYHKKLVNGQPTFLFFCK